MTGPTFGDKLQSIGRRSPADLRALEHLADVVIKRLDDQGVADPAAYRWKCDEPSVTKKGGA